MHMVFSLLKHTNINTVQTSEVMFDILQVPVLIDS